MKNNRRIQKYTLIQQQQKRLGGGRDRGSQEEKIPLYSRMPSNKYGNVDRIEKKSPFCNH